ncbi:SRPBCC family protein [Halomicrococcus sp. NG-SE-24]|uniref:SRPBCC family protein n=1 Tax=Halomicrococcus sp. NG-SE-24 TaxID=3436928 RepID=UPI003D96D6DF
MSLPARNAPADSPSDADAGNVERVASAVFGGVLLSFGLRRRSLVGTAAALVGGWLLYRAVDGDRSLGTPAGNRRGPGVATDGRTVERSITVGESADDLAEYWRDPERLSRVVGHFAEVTPAGEERHCWEVGGPLGRSVSWETRLDADGEPLHWESLPGAAVPNEGSVEFRPAPGDRGTEVTLRVQFDPPGGRVGDAAMNRLGVVPDALAGTALRRFKSLAETGEIPTLERNPSARGSGDLI